MRRWPCTMRADRPVLQTDDLGDLGERPDRVQLVDAADLLLLARALGDERHRLGGAHGAVERLDAPIAADGQRHDHLGEDDRVAQRDEREHLEVLDVGIALFGRVDLGNVLGRLVSCHAGQLLESDAGSSAKSGSAGSVAWSTSSSSNRS